MGNNIPGYIFEKESYKSFTNNENSQTEYHSFSCTPKSETSTNFAQFDVVSEEENKQELASVPSTIGEHEARLMRKLKEALTCIEKIQLWVKRCIKKFELEGKQESSKEMEAYNKNILLVGTQLLCLCELIGDENCDTSRKIEDTLFKYAELIKNEAHQIKVSKKEKICSFILYFAVDFVHKQLLNPIFFAMNEYLGTEVTRSLRTASYLLDELKIQDSKIQMALEFVPYAVIYDRTDLFCLDQKNDERWRRLMKHASIIKIKEDDEVQRSLREFVSKVHVGIAMFDAGSKFSNSILENGAIFWGAVNYFFDRETAKDKATVFYAKPDQKVAFRVWNVLDQNMVVRPLVGFLLPKIEYSKKIFIKQGFREITLNLIDEELKKGTLNKIGDFSSNEDKDNTEKNNDREIMIRVICHSQLFLNDEAGGLLKASSKLIKSAFGFPTDSTSSKEYDSLIFHIHGGGFVAMSSQSHQSYTRRWAKKLKVPIFSVDYRLSPDSPYPAALDDCWQAYNWVINNCEKVYRIKPKKIIVAGDSAGGNLALALCLLCIKLGVRKPDGLYLSYPAINLNTKTFSPSLMLALDDQIVPYSFLKMCLESYLSDPRCDALMDPFISPIIASEELLKCMPPIRLSCGMKDPLHDEMWRFVERILNAGGQIKLKMYREMPHGALSYGISQGMSEADKYIEDSMLDLEELLILEN